MFNRKKNLRTTMKSIDCGKMWREAWAAPHPSLPHPPCRPQVTAPGSARRGFELSPGEAQRQEAEALWGYTGSSPREQHPSCLLPPPRRLRPSSVAAALSPQYRLFGVREHFHRGHKGQWQGGVLSSAFTEPGTLPQLLVSGERQWRAAGAESTGG